MEASCEPKADQRWRLLVGTTLKNTTYTRVFGEELYLVCD